MRRTSQVLSRCKRIAKTLVFQAQIERYLDLIDDASVTIIYIGLVAIISWNTDSSYNTLDDRL